MTAWTPEDRLYGLPDAEWLEDDISTVWETYLDGDDEYDGPWIVEEWSTHPPSYHLPSARRVIDHIEEWAADNEVTCEGDYFNLTDTDILTAAQNLLDVIASKVTWRQSNELIATHTITLVDDEPHVDGEPMYRKVTP